MDLSWVQYIKIFVQVGAWTCAIFLTFRPLADYPDWLPLQSTARRLLKWYDTVGCISGQWQNFRSQKKCFRHWFLRACDLVCFWLQRSRWQRGCETSWQIILTQVQRRHYVKYVLITVLTGIPQLAGNIGERSAVNAIWGVNEAWFIYVGKPCGERKQPYIDRYIPRKTLFYRWSYTGRY